ncbi:peptide/nickel transport system permease protein [Corynebacterium pollutisoli]|uniref:Peptide/nickel transport system permease protein n=1 Tax=Corynebacterium pollutisoli TaxID=1610489 RepID=A0A1X7HZJ9_9CORY|nr:ABC transporter permease [Corynebacterium pollutisoli]SMG07260.1 peptide/nickel transport system permease protein [Corynebacterium pollutisoli]
MIARVLLRFVLSLFLASVVIFLLLRLIPGDPARVALGVTATDEAVEALARQLGTDRPLVVQYLDWVGGLLTGDFGMSLASRQDITPLIIDRAQVSLILCGLAMVLSLLIALPLGMWTANRVLPTLAQIGIAIPSFLTGILLVTVFSVHLGWVPANGWIPPGTDFLGFLQRIILPVIALTLVQAAILTRYVRSAVLEVLDREFIRTARSTGASISEALWRHGLRNAALPVLTVAGLQLTSLIVGAVVIERVFLIPGLGSMLLDSVARRDLTAVQTIVMLLVVFTLTVNLIVDVTYRLIDPRIRRST